MGETYNGLGRHFEIIAKHKTAFLHWNFAHSILILFALALVKVSVSLLLLRIVPQKIYRRILWTTIGMWYKELDEKEHLLILNYIGFLVVYTITCAFTIIFSCTPIAASWDYSLQPTARCFSISTYTGLGIANSGKDISGVFMHDLTDE